MSFHSVVSCHFTGAGGALATSTRISARLKRVVGGMWHSAPRVNATPGMKAPLYYRFGWHVDSHASLPPCYNVIAAVVQHLLPTACSKVPRGTAGRGAGCSGSAARTAPQYSIHTYAGLAQCNVCPARNIYAIDCQNNNDDRTLS